jgi:membrane protease YdiL (CAAX protease family)
MLLINHFIYLHVVLLLFISIQYFESTKHPNNYIQLYYYYNDNAFLYRFIAVAIIMVLYEEFIFRICLTKILEIFIENTYYIRIISSICFSLAHIQNYYYSKKFNLHNIVMGTSQVIYTFILSYFWLQNIHPIYSLLIHHYVNAIYFLINKLLYAYFDKFI